MKMTETVFLEVFEKFKNTVYAVVFNYVRNVEDAADLEQEVFLKLLSHDSEFESEEHMKAWLIRVSINLCKNHMRRRSYMSEGPLPEDLPAAVKEEVVLRNPVEYSSLSYRHDSSVGKYRDNCFLSI